MAINRESARSWSEDRIRAKIEELVDLIEKNEIIIDEEPEYLNRIVWDNKSLRQFADLRGRIQEWRKDVKFLESLL